MTRIAVFSDVHGNTPALEAFFEAVRPLAPDVMVNLGDIASGGVDPRGTLDVLRERPDIMTIRGNQERQLLTRESHDVGGADWLAAQVLTDDDRTWLASLPTRADVRPGVVAFHGAPDDDLVYLLETVDPAVPGTALRQATDDEVLDRLGPAVGTADVFLCGHTHLQRTRELPDGSLVVNPGSLGWPAFADDRCAPHRVEAGSSQARFAILDSASDARRGWVVTQCAIDYDVERAAAMAVENGRDDVAHALRTGRTLAGER